MKRLRSKKTGYKMKPTQTTTKGWSGVHRSIQMRAYSPVPRQD
jgi:hypothetical protein